ncbi:hypothetical protein N8T08_005932 [Aspergillus melleus]|uniref:Uncharacterized protein n=1 Tax=Aspergillus melleus TaxID=138277 RepID=A0ACC3B1N5_9EURO|nr:hypothetical protein N8T08_005932 [Aspergillus melleus]
MTTFLDLPLLIREQIYRHVLVMTRIFVRPFISMNYPFDANRVQNYGIPTLTLLSVCKQIYQEATPIYLRENTFSIVHIDLLAAAFAINLAQFVADQLPNVSAAIDALSPSYQRVTVLRALDAMQLDFPSAEGLLRRSRPSSIAVSAEMDSHMESGMGMESTPSASASTAVLHDRHVENMKEYIWGRTLTFVRKAFRLATLQVDLRRCTCVEGCCRLADEVLRWGWFHVWVNGMPAQVLVRGASPDEKELIVKIFDRQRFHAGVRRDEVYDEGRVLDGRDLDGYASVMRGGFDRVKGGDGL